MPLEYANTISNKANCLWNLPGHPESAETGNGMNLSTALVYYKEAREIFAEHRDVERVRIIGEAMMRIEHELMELGASLDRASPMQS